MRETYCFSLPVCQRSIIPIFLSHSSQVLQSHVKLEETEPEPRSPSCEASPETGFHTRADRLCHLSGLVWRDAGSAPVLQQTRNRREESAQPNLPLVPLGSTGEVPGYGAFHCRQNYLHSYFYDRNTTCILFCYAKLGAGLSKIVTISLTLFSLGEWQDLYPCLRMKLSQQSEVLRKSSPKKINAQYNEICPNSNLSGTHFSSLLSIG